MECNEKSYLDTLPVIKHMAPVAENILAVTVVEGRIESTGQIPYIREEGDEIRAEGKNVVHANLVVRKGQPIGTLVKDSEGEKLWVFEKLVGEKLDRETVQKTESYCISSMEDDRYKEGLAPEAVYIKGKPVNATEPNLNFVIEYTLYIKLPYTFVCGKKYLIDLSKMNLNPARYEYIHNPESVRSEAVHANQVGYRPDDGIKKAFLSTWLGNGGALKYREALDFFLIDESTSEKVFKGRAVLAKSAEDIEYMELDKNYNLTNVYELNFSKFDKPGSYRVYVEGIGCSYGFEIGEKAWEKAFKVAMKGFYHQRSGIELGEPYTDYKRPRCYHPDDGKIIYQSTTSLMDSGNGLNARGTDKGNFANLVAGKTDEIVPGVWGAYFDAGDWDRRIQHLDSSRRQLELLLMIPEYFEDLDLNIPESGNGLADVLNEALWNIDGYRRFQLPDGGVRGGIEAEEHPRLGECSWQDSLTAMIYAPDLWSSYIYSGVAARTAFYLRNINKELSSVYEESAAKAVEWAEKKNAAKEEAKAWTEWVLYEVKHERNLAAIEMYRLTGEKKWHDIYLETKGDGQRDAEFVYATLPDNMADSELKQMCIDIFIREGNSSIEYAKGNAFNLTTPNRKRYYGLYSGFYTVPDAISLIRAHYITGEKKYIDATVQACQFTGGANPLNTVFTTGIGHKAVENLLHHDSRRSGQKVPAGISPYGNFDASIHMNHWMIKLMADREVCIPHISQWPAVEDYFDVYIFPEQTEWTMHQTMSPKTYVLGYLAARK